MNENTAINMMEKNYSLKQQPGRTEKKIGLAPKREQHRHQISLKGKDIP